MSEGAISVMGDSEVKPDTPQMAGGIIMGTGGSQLRISGSRCA